jgi:hypothetical protein
MDNRVVATQSNKTNVFTVGIKEIISWVDKLDWPILSDDGCCDMARQSSGNG